MGNSHLNIFEYYKQEEALPIENNHTRDLAIVLNSSELLIDRFWDFVNQKTPTIKIVKPVDSDDWDIDIQQQIADLANEDREVSKIIGITLTTNNNTFGDYEHKDDSTSITDMVISCKDVLMIIEVKRNNVDATRQLSKQLNEYIKGRKDLDHGFECISENISVTWEETIEIIEAVDNLQNRNEYIVSHYLEHMKKRCPSFFPVQCFNKLDSNYVLANIEKRIGLFARNYQENEYGKINTRDKSKTPIHWIKLSDKTYIRELAYVDYSNNLSLVYYPGNNKGQGWHLYKNKNGLSILNHPSININGLELDYEISANLKISNAWGKYKFDVNVNSIKKEKLKAIFKTVCGKKKSSDNIDFIDKLKLFTEIDYQSFELNFLNYFKTEKHDYTYLVSLTLCIKFPNMLEKFKNIDISCSPESDSLVIFTKEITSKIYELIEN